MAMHGFTVLVLLALLAAPAPAARAPAVQDEALLEDADQSSAVSLGGADVQNNAVARQEGAQLHNSTTAGPEGWAHRKVREAWGQGDLPGQMLQAAARHVSAGVSMLQDSERLGVNLSGHATRIAASGISVLQHGAGRFGHLEFGRGAPAASPGATPDFEKDVEMEVEKDLGASSEQVKTAENKAWIGPASQILFALLYYFFIASAYPKLLDNAQISQEVSEFQQNSVLAAPCHCSPNVFLALFCPVARAAHTMDAADIMDFWSSCVLMTICPCPTLWMVHTVSDLRGKLGGAPRGCLADCFCATFCTCCVISQDAIALDMITGASTGLCGVTPSPEAPPAAAGGPEPGAAAQ